MLNKLHHIGIVVNDIKLASFFYKDILGFKLTHEETIQDQGVHAVLLNASNCEIELLQPIDNISGVAKYLKKSGDSFHHLCFSVDNIENELYRLKKMSISGKDVRLIDEKARKGLVGDVAFIHPESTNNVLVEIAKPTKLIEVDSQLSVYGIIFWCSSENAFWKDELLGKNLTDFNPKLEFKQRLSNEDENKIHDVSLVLFTDDLLQIKNNLDLANIQYKKRKDEDVAHINFKDQITISSKNSFGMDIIFLEF